MPDPQTEAIEYYAELARHKGLAPPAGQPAPEAPRASLPTYSTVADVLEKKNGSGWRLLGWTIARTALIAPPFMLVGVPTKQALGGAAIASAMISVLTLIRIADAGEGAGVVGSTSRDVALIGAAPSRGRGNYR